MILILGAGFAGISTSFHIGHNKCLVLEKSARAFGHAGSEQRNGFTWDHGPHVSFTKHDYVKTLFAEGVDDEFEEYEVRAGNYFKGCWIDHPAQSSLHQVPEPLRTQCLNSFLQSRSGSGKNMLPPANYEEWLERAFGPKFARIFPCAYTRKYWTREAKDLSTDWIGERVFYPDVQDVIEGSRGALGRQTHYITMVRYPRNGGYQSFARKLFHGCHIRYGAEVVSIDLEERTVGLASGEKLQYTMLINTLPLPVFINACRNVPENVGEAAAALSCSQLLLVNIAARHPTVRPENWIYVYDEDKLATRINCTEKLAKGNAPAGWTGVQTEVYFSRHRQLALDPTGVAARVKDELLEMGLIDVHRLEASDSIRSHTVYSPWANVIFDHQTKPALQTIWAWLEQYGLVRESDDLSPLTNWVAEGEAFFDTDPKIFMSGRFGQWKYYWTDDCVLRGRQIANRLNSLKTRSGVVSKVTFCG